MGKEARDPNDKKAWFEISDSGWRVQNLGRPLASLLYEGIQNSFDQEVTKVSVDVRARRIVIEDNGKVGFADPKLAYTVFLTDKGTSAVMRGRHGRGLKELISAMDSTVIDTVGFSLSFGSKGRNLSPNNRKRGTTITLERDSSAAEIDEAVKTLRMLMPPDGVTVRINGTKVKSPRRFVVLSGCKLETVVAKDGAEKHVERVATVTLLHTRDAKEKPHIFEMGLPVQPAPTPWHIDVGQRIPLGDRRDRGADIAERYQLRLLAIIFESLVPETLPTEQLKDNWINEVIARCKLSDHALNSYTKRALPPRCVLPSSSTDDDRAQQTGATVLDTRTMSKGQIKSLGRVLQTSEQYVAHRKQVQERVKAAEPYEQRAVAFFGQLAKRILERTVAIKLVRKQASEDGFIESATYDRKRHELRINVEGKMDLADPMSPQTLGILFHELAHFFGAEHNQKFIEHLEKVSGRGANILAREGRALAHTCGISFDGPGETKPAFEMHLSDQGAAHWNTPAPISLKQLKESGGGSGTGGI